MAQHQQCVAARVLLSASRESATSSWLDGLACLASQVGCMAAATSHDYWLCADACKQMADLCLRCYPLAVVSSRP
jgi:hypothetical protein